MLANAATMTPVPPVQTTDPDETDTTEKPHLTVAYVTPPPAEHDGRTPFTFSSRFSEELGDYSFSTMRDASLSIFQGRRAASCGRSRGRGRAGSAGLPG